MIFIVEGPDGVGKTTLINELVKRFIAEDNEYICTHIIKCDGPEPDGFFKYHGACFSPFKYFYLKLLEAESIIRDDVQNHKIPIIFFDRFFMSNFVYGNVFHNQPLLTIAEVTQLKFKLNYLGWDYIYIFPQEKNEHLFYQRRIRNNKDFTNVGFTSYIKIIELYNRIIKNEAKFQYYRFTTIRALREQPVKFFIDMYNLVRNITIEHYINNSNLITYHITHQCEASGNLAGNVAIIGLSVNTNNNMGFVDPFIGGCGRWLYGTIGSIFTSRSINQLYITNLYKSTGKMLEDEELKKYEVLIVLGIETRKLLKLDVKSKRVITMNHPAWVKRFHSSSFYNYYATILVELKELLDDNYQYDETATIQRAPVDV